MPKISGLPAGTVGAGAETYPAAQSGETVRLTADQIINTFSATRSISLAYFGVVADGTTDDTAAFNSAIAYANANGGNISFIVPRGTTRLVSTSTVITAANVFFVGSGTPQTCIIKTLTNQGVKWSGADGGGMLNVGLDSDGGINRVSLNLPNVARMRFDNIWLGSGISQLAVLGDYVGGTAASEVSFSRVRGAVASVAASLITCKFGAGLYVSEFDLFPNATPAISGRNFITFAVGGWDLATIDNCVLQVFDSPLVIDATNGQAVQSIRVSNNFFDAMLNGPQINTQPTGATYAIEFYDNEMSAYHGTTGRCFYVQSSGGVHYGLRIHRNRFLQCQFDGILLPAQIVNFSVIDNHIHAVNRAAGAYDGISIAAGAYGGIISGNSVGNLNSTGADVPRYGLNLGNVSNVVVSGNLLNGSTAGALFGTLTACEISGNQSFTAEVADASAQTPASTVANLPSAVTSGAGRRRFVTNANATTFLSIVAGGGANKVPVVSDGTNWLIG